jgi:hypothetical protein
VELDVDGGEGEITGVEAVPRVPLVAERRVDSVPMGKERRRKGRWRRGWRDQIGIRTRTSDTM